jgi:putative CRISPR-associated protein (TIGR02619 family)
MTRDTMPFCVILTTGTSVFGNAPKGIQDDGRAFGKRKDIDIDAICGDSTFEGQALYEQALNYLHSQSNAIEIIRRASAELNSLSRILDRTHHGSHQLHFLATDTPDGSLAARIIADFAKAHFRVEVSKVHRVQGLQVEDGHKFQRDGIRNLIGIIYDILNDASPGTYRRVIYPTGGFKSVVPYLTLIGMIEPEIEISYIYETSSELITLGRLPFKLDIDLLENAYLALKRGRDLIYENELRELLKIAENEPIEGHPAWALFSYEEDQGLRLFGTNGLGNIVLRHYEALASKAKVYLSRQANERYKTEKQKGSEAAKRWKQILDNISDRTWRDQHRHEYKTCKFPAAKLSRTQYRAFYDYDTSLDKVLILEFAIEVNQDYDRTPTDRKDYDDHRLWEIKPPSAKAEGFDTD